MTEKAYNSCALCAHRCGVDRTGSRGRCRMGAAPVISRAALHIWEEPPISGTRGSGTIFFVGCSLGCVYCQNREISRGNGGTTVTKDRLSEIMLRLESEGAHNINLVTPTHYTPDIIAAVAKAREQGLKIPIVYNTGSYDTADTIRALKDTVDVFLPDLKYYRADTARSLSHAPDYPEVARAAIAEMVALRPEPRFARGIMVSGVIVRLLLLPGHLAEAKLNLKYLYSTYGDSIYVSLMSQYTPAPDLRPPLNRRVTRAEYNELVDYAIRLGVKNAFTQEHASATADFIPAFDNTGVGGI